MDTCFLDVLHHAADVEIVSIEERVDIGVKVTTGGKVGDSKLLPEIAHRNGVPLSLAVAPVVAAILVNKYL